MPSDPIRLRVQGPFAFRGKTLKQWLRRIITVSSLPGRTGETSGNSRIRRWEAPFVVTTAVQFFETLAANQTVPLPKFHQVPGSAIFVGI
jgi:hypothetical protein